MHESPLRLLHPVVFSLKRCFEKGKEKGKQKSLQIKMCRVLENCHSFAQGFLKKRKTEQQTEFGWQEVGRESACFWMQQQRGWGSLNPCCSKPVLPLGVSSTKGKTIH